MGENVLVFESRLKSLFFMCVNEPFVSTSAKGYFESSVVLRLGAPLCCVIHFIYKCSITVPMHFWAETGSQYLAGFPVSLFKAIV